MFRRQFLKLAAIAAVLPMFHAAHAAEPRAFDRDAFRAAQQQGRRILVDITASWCPTCRAQKPVIESLATKPEFDGIVVFDVDFDSQKNIVREFGATAQSTLIVFRGKRETARSVGETNPARIEALVRTAFEG